MKIVLHRYHGGLRVNPAPPYVEDYLKFWKREMQVKGYKRTTGFTEQQLFVPDGGGGLYTLHGFYKDLVAKIEGEGDEVEILDERPGMPEVDWGRIKKIGLRDYQVDPTVEWINALGEESGLFIGAGGFGLVFLQQPR